MTCHMYGFQVPSDNHGMPLKCLGMSLWSSCAIYEFFFSVASDLQTFSISYIVGLSIIVYQDQMQWKTES